MLSADLYFFELLHYSRYRSGLNLFNKPLAILPA